MFGANAAIHMVDKVMDNFFEDIPLEDPRKDLLLIFSELSNIFFGNTFVLIFFANPKVPPSPIEVSLSLLFKTPARAGCERIPCLNSSRSSEPAAGDSNDPQSKLNSKFGWVSVCGDVSPGGFGLGFLNFKFRKF